MPTEIELATRLFAAMLLGGAIGFERELTGQVAGLRTHMMVALGSALFAIVSAYGFDEFAGPRANTNYQIDVTRVASNIVTGVGFLGGGAILKDGGSVKGLTTAASLWVTAAVGLAMALGSFVTGTVTALSLVFALTLLRAPRLWLRQHFADHRESVSVQIRPDGNAGAVVTRLRQMRGVEVTSVRLRDNEDEVLLQADLRGPDLDTCLADLAAMGDVVGVRLGPP